MSKLAGRAEPGDEVDHAVVGPEVGQVLDDQEERGGGEECPRDRAGELPGDQDGDAQGRGRRQRGADQVQRAAAGDLAKLGRVVLAGVVMPGVAVGAAAAGAAAAGSAPVGAGAAIVDLGIRLHGGVPNGFEKEDFVRAGGADGCRTGLDCHSHVTRLAEEVAVEGTEAVGLGGEGGVVRPAESVAESRIPGVEGAGFAEILI